MKQTTALRIQEAEACAANAEAVRDAELKRSAEALSRCASAEAALIERRALTDRLTSELEEARALLAVYVDDYSRTEPYRRAAAAQALLQRTAALVPS